MPRKVCAQSSTTQHSDTAQHKIAIKWMNKCKDTERQLDEHIEEGLVSEGAERYDKRPREGSDQQCSARRARVGEG
eukprot:6114225-Pyramimonas_sp.AAC.1